MLKTTGVGANQEIRDALAKTGVRQWQLADAVGYADNYFCVKMRREFPAEVKAEMLAIIDQLAKEVSK